MKITLSCNSDDKNIVHQFKANDADDIRDQFENFLIALGLEVKEEGLYSGISFDYESDDEKNDDIYTYKFEHEMDTPSQATYRVDDGYKMDDVYEIKASDLSSTWPFPEGSRP